MYCTNCGKKLLDGSKFCDKCGTKTPSDVKLETPKVEKVTTLGKIMKCPVCGETLNYGSLKCPSCQTEIIGREATNAVQVFSEKITYESNEDRKIELIKTFPIPNNREDIIEFMLLATSNYDASYYASNKAYDSIARAWLSKIDQCYNKGKILFTEQNDLYIIEKMYSEVHTKTKKIEKHRFILTLLGLIFIITSSIVITETIESKSPLAFLATILLILGIVFLVKGLSKNKTNKQMMESRSLKRNSNNVETYQRRFGKKVNKNLYVFMTIFLGGIGIHKFYAGKTGMGLIYFFTFGLFYFGWFFDILSALLQRADTNGNIWV
jgi:uncharacterized membrane protein HdeD (DUF308 family)